MCAVWCVLCVVCYLRFGVRCVLLVDGCLLLFVVRCLLFVDDRRSLFVSCGLLFGVCWLLVSFEVR